jgi:2-polyprenyl-6-methoxyphenol hydroxylase-like FAD-dependent oxidoreductase
VNYQAKQFAYKRSQDHDAAQPARHPVVIVGAGPVGMTLALDLAQRGVRVLLLDDDDKLSTGSRAICFAKRTLEIFDRLGVGSAMVAKGVSWNVGKVFLQDALVYSFDLLAEAGHKHPAFVNLQQYYVEGFLADAVAANDHIEVRWKHRVLAVDHGDERAVLTVGTPDGTHPLHADYLVACDGSRSAVRKALGLESKGQTFRDRFLIADVKMTAPFPINRYFCIDNRMMCGASIFSSAGMPIPMRKRSQRTCAPECRRCSGRTRNSSLNGSASTPLPACAWSAFVMGACCSRAIARIWCRRLAHAARIPAFRTPTIWVGSWPAFCVVMRAMRCSIATRLSANMLPTKTF